MLEKTQLIADKMNELHGRWISNERGIRDFFTSKEKMEKLDNYAMSLNLNEEELADYNNWKAKTKINLIKRQLRDILAMAKWYEIMRPDFYEKLMQEMNKSIVALNLNEEERQRYERLLNRE